MEASTFREVLETEFSRRDDCAFKFANGSIHVLSVLNSASIAKLIIDL